MMCVMLVEDEPWKRVNSYNVHPTHEWKDLNQKFILQVYRDYHATEDKMYLSHMYPIMKVWSTLLIFKATFFVLLIVPSRYFCSGSFCFMSWCLKFFVLLAPYVCFHIFS